MEEVCKVVRKGKPLCKQCPGFYRRFNWTKVKQVATLGPSCFHAENIEQLFMAGVDCFRLNMSHGNQEDSRKMMENIRNIEKKYKHPIAIMLDLQGPKPRIGDIYVNKQLQTQVVLKEQDKVMMEFGHVGQQKGLVVMVPHKEVFECAKLGGTLLLDDGKIRLAVSKVFKDARTGHAAEWLECQVLEGGILEPRKGLNMPNVMLKISAVTGKDKKDIQFAVENHADWIALSFVQTPQDVEELRELLNTSSIKIISKIEKACAVSNLEEVVWKSDAVMVARGDLGVEMPPEKIPVIQKKIITTCNKLGRPVVVATQMLESMILSPHPTRAEASDVANAIYDGADGVMLSGETAVGKFPEKAVRMQQKIIKNVERDPIYQEALASLESRSSFINELPQSQYNPIDFASSPTSFVNSLNSDAIASAAKLVAEKIKAKCIVSFTNKGLAVSYASVRRPAVPILAVTPSMKTGRWLQLLWGVYSVVDSKNDNELTVDEILQSACSAVLDQGLAEPDDFLVITAGLPFGKPGSTNLLRVCQAKGPNEWPVRSHKISE